MEKIKTSDGWTLEVIGAGPKDVLFTSEKFGSFNVTVAKAFAEKNCDVAAAPMHREGVRKLLSNIDIDQVRLVDLRKQEKFHPLLALEMDDGTAFIIDGHHRLQVLWERGCPIVLMRIIPKELRNVFKIQMQGRRGNEVKKVDNIEVLEGIVGIYHDEKGVRREH